MLLRCLKKMYKNKWIYAALTFGLILSIITVIVLPMFTRASQDRLIRQTLDEYKTSKGIYPVSVKYSYKNVVRGKGRGAEEFIDKVNEEFINKVDTVSIKATEKFKFPIISSKQILITPKVTFWDLSQDILKNPSYIIQDYELISFKELEKYVTVLKGKMPTNSNEKDGIKEVIVHKNIYNKYNLDMDKIYKTTLEVDVAPILDTLNKSQYEYAKFKIVGVYENKESNFWIRGEWNPGEQFFITDMDTHKAILDVAPDRYEYINEYCLDYSELKYSQISGDPKESLIEVFKEAKSAAAKSSGETVWNLENILKKIEGKMKSTISMMLIILVPLIFILILYVLMISKIIANNDSNEISLLKSRGAKLYQIFVSYVLQGIIMGGIGIIVAPIIAKYVVKAMGGTTEFLKFGSITDFYGYIKPSDYLLSIIVIVIFIIAMLIPVYRTSKKNIVELKRDRFRVSQVSFWKRYGIDIIILAFSIYCFYSFIMKESADTRGSMETYPLIYLVISGMCLGLTLLFLRIYPFIIKCIFRIGKKIWKPETYYTLLYSARNSSKMEYIMIFLIFTLSIGLFNMNSARKLNREGEHNILYKNGADIVVSESFGSEERDYDRNYKKYSEIEGIENATKVLVKSKVRIDTETRTMGARYMAIVPHEFGKLAWMREDLFPTHWYNYLNNLTIEPSGVLVSSNMIKDGFNLGDVININLPQGVDYSNDQQDITFNIKCRIIGSFNYWPSWDSKKLGHENLIVGNFENLIESTEPMKYNVWLGVKEGKKSDDIKEALIKNKIIPQSFQVKDKEIEKFKKDMFVQTINGTYTFAFIITMIIAFTGFVVYWTLSIKERELQFGIIRALGVGKGRVYKMIFFEQIISTVVALGVGVTIGTNIFSMVAPITNETNIQGSIELPILKEYLKSDYITVLTIVGTMTLIVLMILMIYISKLKVSQAVKLGED